MGRLIGIKYFLGNKAYTQEKSWQATLRRLRRESLDDTRADDISPEDHDPYKGMQCVIAQDIRKKYGDRLLRRTIASLGYDGKPLISLPPLVEHTFVVDLEPWESEIMEGLATKVAAE